VINFPQEDGAAVSHLDFDLINKAVFVMSLLAVILGGILAST
jgi:hypothetical protein